MATFNVAASPIALPCDAEQRGMAGWIIGLRASFTPVSFPRLSRGVQTTFLIAILLPPPAPSPLRLAKCDRARTWCAANRREALIMERINGNSIC